MSNKLVYRWLLVSVLVSAFLLSLSTAWAQIEAVHAVAHPAARGAVHLQVRNGLFHVMDGVLLNVPRLDAWMVPAPGHIVSLDNKKSFVIQINSGQTYLKAQDLNGLMNEYLLSKAKTPIKNISVSFEGNEVVVKGDLRKLVNIPFEGRGTVTVSDDTGIRLHFTEFKAAGILKKGFLDALGIKLSSVAQPKKQSRFYIEGDDIILPITALFPPPRVTGKLTAVLIHDDELVQIFGPPNADVPPPPTPAVNFLYFRGGRMKFGKLTMEDVDLELVDQDPKDYFDFSLDHYAEQLSAGYSKSLPSRGLVAFVPDYSAVGKAQGAPKKD